MHAAFSPIRLTLLAAALASTFPLHAQETLQPGATKAEPAQPASGQKMQTVEVKGSAK